MNMLIAQRLNRLFVGMIFIFCLFFTLEILGLYQHKAIANRTVDTAAKTYDQINLVYHDLGRVRVQIDALVVQLAVGTRPIDLLSTLQNVQNSLQELEKSTNQLMKYPPDRQVAQIHANTVGYLTALKSTLKLIDASGNKSKVSLMLVDKQYQVLDRQMQERLHTIENTILHARQVSHRTMHFVFIALSIIVILVIAVSTDLLRCINRDIIFYCRRCIELAGEVGRGNFSHRIEVFHRDEFGQLTEVLNHMASNLKTKSQIPHGSELVCCTPTQSRNGALKNNIQYDDNI